MYPEPSTRISCLRASAMSRNYPIQFANQKHRGGLHANCHSALLLERLHDDRVVRPSSIPGQAANPRYCRELVDSLRRVLLSGPGKSHRLLGVLRLPAKDHSGDHHPDSLRSFRLRLFGRSAALELRRLLRMHPGRRGLRILGKTLGAALSEFSPAAVLYEPHDESCEQT